MNQLLEKIKQGEHVFDVNAEPKPEEDNCLDFDADYEEGQGDNDDGDEEYKDGCEISGSGRARQVQWLKAIWVTFGCFFWGIR